MKLNARLIALVASLAGETDAVKRAALASLISKKSAKLAAKAKGGDDDPDDDGDDDEDESKAKMAAEKAEKAKKAAKAAAHRARKADYLKKAEEAEEEAKKCESDEEEEASKGDEEEAKAALAGSRAEALLAKLSASVTGLEKAQIATTKATLIGGARKLGAITKTEAAWLEGQTVAAIESFLEMRSKAGLVVTDEDALLKPKPKGAPGSLAALPESTQSLIKAAVEAYPLPDKAAYEKTLVEAHTKAHAATNGASGRY